MNSYRFLTSVSYTTRYCLMPFKNKIFYFQNYKFLFHFIHLVYFCFSFIWFLFFIFPTVFFVFVLEEPFLNEHTVARPLVVIPSQNHHQHLNNNHHHHPTHSLSPQSYDASRSRSSSLSSNPITANCVHHVLTGGEDSSQSSLNLSASSGYLSGSSANSSVGGSNLNLSGITAAPLSTSSTSSLHVNGASPDHQAPQPQQLTNNRRRTISSNSNG